MIFEAIGILVMAFTIGLTGALAPGPTLVATINSSLKTGWTAGPKVATGHAIVEMFVFMLIIVGLAVTLEQYSRIIAIIGGLALVTFGLLTIGASKNAALVTTSSYAISSPYLAGIITSAANPYFWIWWLSIGSALLMNELKTSLILASLFMIGHWCADFFWYTLVSTSFYKGRRIISEANYRKILNICGCFLILFGIYYMTRTYSS
jgi:threonine/homoserine/homoserine lactone efflux protein